MSETTFSPSRLQDAILHLSKAQEQALCKEAKVATGAIKGALTKLADLPSQSVLSDMLSGRTPGHRYQARIAALLGIDQRWLEGDDRFAPSWRMSPLMVFERFSNELAAAWLHSRGARNGMKTWDLLHWPPVVPADHHQIARALSQPLGSPDVMNAAAGRFEEVSAPVLLQLAAYLKLKGETDLDRLEDGRLVARVIERRVAKRLNDSREERDRLLLGGACAQVIRLGLQLVKTQRRYQGKDLSVVNAAQELVWRQTLTRSGRSLRHLPEACIDEVGRPQLSELHDLQPYLADTGPDDSMHSDDEMLSTQRG